MDHPLVNDALSSAVNPSVYSLAEIWPFGGELQSGVLGLRIGNLGPNFAGFGGGSGNRGGLPDESPATEQGRRGWRRKRKDVGSEDESSKMNDSNAKPMKMGESNYESYTSKAEVEVERNSAKGTKPDEPSSKLSEPPKEYIHVRARRGQATDSHSLGERARREKISERMKILQELVPGCNKVIGKAHVLDEIINYIQSLQRQVEFLSMKLETVNSRMNSIEGYAIKDSGEPAYDGAGMVSGWQAMPREYAQGLQHEWLHERAN